jgi:hypothetical protein
MNNENNVTSQPEKLQIDAVIIRADGTREDLGTVSYYHKNPLKRLAYRLKRIKNPFAKV